MAEPTTPAELAVARLEARVAALEEALRRRSRELRLLAEHACWRDLRLMARVAAGVPPEPAGPFDPEFWSETTDLEEAEVPATMRALWRSQRAADAAADPGDPGDPDRA